MTGSENEVTQDAREVTNVLNQMIVGDQPVFQWPRIGDTVHMVVGQVAMDTVRLYCPEAMRYANSWPNKPGVGQVLPMLVTDSNETHQYISGILFFNWSYRPIWMGSVHHQNHDSTYPNRRCALPIEIGRHDHWHYCGESKLHCCHPELNT